MPKKKSPPSYRLHKARNCAVVTIRGTSHYLGPHGSPGSYEKYARLIGEHFRTLPTLFVLGLPNPFSSECDTGVERARRTARLGRTLRPAEHALGHRAAVERVGALGVWARLAVSSGSVLVFGLAGRHRVTASRDWV